MGACSQKSKVTFMTRQNTEKERICYTNTRDLRCFAEFREFRRNEEIRLVSFDLNIMINRGFMELIGIAVGASPIGKEKAILDELLNNHNTYVIAADGGIDYFLERKIAPDEWIGDMDSAGQEKLENVNVIFPKLVANACSPIKDDTDTAIALEILKEHGCKEIHVFGGMGGKRPEHSMANIQLIHHYALCNIKVFLHSERSLYYVIYNSKEDFGAEEKGFISLFALTDSCELSIKGLFYEYEGSLLNSYALGVSNEFCGKAASIDVKQGVLLVIRTEKYD